MMDIEEDLLLWFKNFFDKKPALLAPKYASGDAAKSEIMQYQQLAEELHKPITI